MDDLTFGIEEELELDYEAEEARKAKEIAEAVACPSSNKSNEEDDDGEEEGDDIDDAAAEEDEGESDGEINKKSVPITSFPKSRKRKSSPPKWNRGIINDEDEVEPGRDIIRGRSNNKRFRYQPQLLPAIFFPDEKDPDEPIEDVIDDHPALSKTDVALLFDSLDVDMDDDTIPLNTIYVYGVEGMTHYQLEKVFAEYHPHIVLFVESNSCIVQFRQSRIAAKMLIGMTRKLKRIRKAKKIEEEGEIMDSDGEEEEGQTKTEDGEIILIVSKEPLQPLILHDDDVNDSNAEVSIDVKKFKVPKGKWRVVTKHLPTNKILILRYAKQSEIQKANRNTANTEYRSERANSTNTKRLNRLKGGINVFDSTGKELPWNFEHDTRIFNDPSLKGLEDSYLNEQEEKKMQQQQNHQQQQPQEETFQIGEHIIHSKGRGTKRAMNLHFSSDEEESGTESESKAEVEKMDDADAAAASDEPKTTTTTNASIAIDDSILDDSPPISPPPSPKESDNFRSQVLSSKK